MGRSSLPDVRGAGGHRPDRAPSTDHALIQERGARWCFNEVCMNVVAVEASDEFP